MTMEEIRAYNIAYLMYKFNYDELWDALYHYLYSYKHHYYLDKLLYTDEIENYLDIRDHDLIIKEILKHGETYRFKK